jgi:hypothetical protein
MIVNIALGIVLGGIGLCVLYVGLIVVGGIFTALQQAKKAH